MNRISIMILIISVILGSIAVHSLAAEEVTLDDIIKNNETTQPENLGQQEDKPDKTSSFIKRISNTTDLSADVEGVAEVTQGIKKPVAFLVQVISFLTTILLTLRIALDLMFIGLPFCRKWLANGYTGNTRAGSGAIQAAMGMGNAGTDRTNTGSLEGSDRKMNMGNVRIPIQSGQQQVLGKMQLISNAALNAVAGETMVGPDGKPVSPFRIYIKDMVVVLVITPILLTLAVTGALTTLGSQLGALLVESIRSIKDMM